MSQPSAVTPDRESPPADASAAVRLVADLSAGAGFLRAIGGAVTGGTDRGRDDVRADLSSVASDFGGTQANDAEHRCPYCGRQRRSAAETAWRADGERNGACAGCAASMARKEAAWRGGEPLP